MNRSRDGSDGERQNMPLSDLVAELLRRIERAPLRAGLLDTPNRVAAAYSEWFSGYDTERQEEELFKTFEDIEWADEMVLVANIPVYSHCAHHIAPFWGLAHIAYIPTKAVLGLSKFARLVDLYAKRLQMQERLTQQIGVSLYKHLQPTGVGVVLECRHMCLESRGVRMRGSVTTTSALYGAMRIDPATRAEFLSLVRSASRAREGI